jgi:putative transposase
VRYQFIQKNAQLFPVASLCRVMQVSKSGYYAAKGREPSNRQQEREILLEAIQKFSRTSDGTYGSIRIWKDIKECEELITSGVFAGRHRVARIMRQAGLKAIVAPKFVVTTDSKHDLPIAQNLLNRDFGAAEANVKWASDITYIWTREGWLYLAVVLDLFSRRIVGWCMQPTMDRSIVLKALEMALGQRQPGVGIVHHSDRGSQYASSDFQSKLAESDICCSMSRRGNCWDNAPVESFFGTLKQELVHRCDFVTRAAARSKIFYWLEVWYNRHRRHSSLDYLSPVEFERRSLEAGSVPSLSSSPLLN